MIVSVIFATLVIVAFYVGVLYGEIRLGVKVAKTLLLLHFNNKSEFMRFYDVFFIEESDQTRQVVLSRVSKTYDNVINGDKK